MAEIDYRPRHLEQAQARKEGRLKWTSEWWFRILALLLLVELFVPFAFWKAGLPRSTETVTDLIPALLLALLFAYMLVRDRIPRGVLLVLAITLIWAVPALLEGQSLAATAWGWWRVFKYPLLGIFAFLIPRWPDDFARYFLKLCVILLAFQVGVQLLQFATGTPAGDSLAGTFAWKGVGPMTMFVFFVVSLGLGHWLGTHQWKVMLLVLSLGLVASMLNVTKFYLVAVALLGVATLVLHLIRGGQFKQLFIYVVLFSLSAAAFVPIYNSVIAEIRGLKPLQEYLTADAIEGYLFNDGAGAEDGTYNLGRGLAMSYAWQQIRTDTTTTLFGFGLGSRSSSTALNLSGVGFEDDLYGGAGTTGLSTWMQEYGLVGLGLFLLLMLWMSWQMLKHARATSDPLLASLEYGLILFTMFWPVWLWYHKAWIFNVMMILYWVSVGYVFQQIYRDRRKKVSKPVVESRGVLPPVHANGVPATRPIKRR